MGILSTDQSMTLFFLGFKRIHEWVLEDSLGEKEEGSESKLKVLLSLDGKWKSDRKKYSL